jgi:hypothetical protein
VLKERGCFLASIMLGFFYLLQSNDNKTFLTTNI